MRFGRLAAVGAATAGLALIATPASALTIDYSGGNPVHGSPKGDTTLTANGQVLTCTGSTIEADVHPGTSNPAATITDATWTGCDWNGYPAYVTVTNPSWYLNAVSGMTNANTDQAVTGTITNISGVSVLIDGPLGDCSFKVGGAVNAVFNEWTEKDTQEVTVLSSGSTLTVSERNNIFTCVGLVNNGNTATFAGSYNLDTDAGEINVKP